jgi:prevent-host-death family protein
MTEENQPTKPILVPMMELRSSPGRFITAALRGFDVVLTQNGTPIARIIRYEEEK